MVDYPVSSWNLLPAPPTLGMPWKQRGTWPFCQLRNSQRTWLYIHNVIVPFLHTVIFPTYSHISYIQSWYFLHSLIKSIVISQEIIYPGDRCRVVPTVIYTYTLHHENDCLVASSIIPQQLLWCNCVVYTKFVSGFVSFCLHGTTWCFCTLSGPIAQRRRILYTVNSKDDVLLQVYW